MIKKIISDSGANVLHLDDASFENIPLTIHVDGTDYQDDASLSVIKMTEKLQRHAQALRNGKKPSKELMKSMQSRLRACFPEATILPFKQQICIAKTIRKQRFTSSIRFQPGPRWNLSSTS